jgi:hypothetical protein
MSLPVTGIPEGVDHEWEEKRKWASEGDSSVPSRISRGSDRVATGGDE